jgi:hypothetical protein
MAKRSEDADYRSFMHARRHLATVPGKRGRELAYIIEVQDLEEAIREKLDLIRKRDGKRFFREAKAYLNSAITI